jgi:hypothetical protein
MLTFLKKIFLFLTPVALLFLPATAILFSAGEFYPPQKLGELARGSRAVIVGAAYSNVRGDYQLQETLFRKPEIIALGTSRVGGFRSVFFNKPSVFYNDTGTGGVLSNFRYFLEKISEHPPRIIIAGMDPQLFNPEEEAKNSIVTRPDPFVEHVPWYGPFFDSLFLGDGWWKIYPDYFAGKFTLQQVFGSRDAAVTLIGLRAVGDRNGFLNDGSNYYGDVIHDSQNQKKALEGIDSLAASISDSFGDEYGSGISPVALAEVRNFLATAKKKGSIVIGFIPPISHAEYQRLKAFPNAPYAYAFKNLPSVLAGIYAEYGYDFYNFGDVSSFGGSDSEMVEAKHGSEKVYLRLFIKMAQMNKALAPLVNIPMLKQKLNETKSNYEVFPL